MAAGVAPNLEWSSRLIKWIFIEKTWKILSAASSLFLFSIMKKIFDILPSQPKLQHLDKFLWKLIVVKL